MEDLDLTLYMLPIIILLFAVQNEDEMEPAGETMVIWDYTKQPPDKIILDVWDPYSSLHNTVQLISSLAYFLASRPGLWPWSRSKIEHSL